MKPEILFSGEMKKNISTCRLLKILPRVLSVKHCETVSERSGKDLFYVVYTNPMFLGKLKYK